MFPAENAFGFEWNFALPKCLSPNGVSNNAKAPFHSRRKFSVLYDHRQGSRPETGYGSFGRDLFHTLPEVLKVQ